MLEQQEVYFKSDIFNKYFNMIKNERFNVRMTHPEEENRNNLQGDQEKKKNLYKGEKIVSEVETVPNKLTGWK